MTNPDTEAELIRAAIDEEIESLLLREEPGVDYNISSIDFSVFGQSEEAIKEVCVALVKWLKIPCVHDRFGDDNEARYTWLDGMLKQYGKPFKEEFGKFRPSNKFYDAIHSSQSPMLYNLFTLLERNNFGHLADQIKKAWKGIKAGDLPKDNVTERKRSIEQLEKRVVACLDLVAAYSQKRV